MSQPLVSDVGILRVVYVIYLHLMAAGLNFLKKIYDMI